MSAPRLYFVFRTTMHTIAAYRELEDAGISGELVSNPPGIPDCGIALRLAGADRTRAEELLADGETPPQRIVQERPAD
ncbi:MAG: DUF3343 domain-containing protein [Candidatus Coatesbacteria bacterium]|nr:DUF3343 domain-containing protein [Candidatus Coatesbacteria bacterium]